MVHLPGLFALFCIQGFFVDVQVIALPPVVTCSVHCLMLCRICFRVSE